MTRRPSLVDTRVIYGGDCLDRLKTLPPACIDLIYIDPPFNSNRNYEVFWGESTEKRAFEDRHASTQAYIEYMRPRCVELARVLKKTGSFYYHCDWHASHYAEADPEAPRPVVSMPAPPCSLPFPPGPRPCVPAPNPGRTRDSGPRRSSPALLRSPHCSPAPPA